MSGPINWDDPELQDIFEEDPGLRDLAARVHSSRPEPVLDPRFQNVLRARVMEAARAELRPRRAFFSFRPGTFAFAGSAFAAGLAAVVVVSSLSHGSSGGSVDVASCSVGSQSCDAHNVVPLSAADTITVSFSVPMDHASVETALQIHPAVQHAVTWKQVDGRDTLVITPAHGLAGNTSYTVSIDSGTAASAAGAHPAGDIHLSFGTAPTPAASATPSPRPVSGPVTLHPVSDGPVTGAAHLFFTPDGLLYATDAPSTGTPAASSSPAASPSSSAGAPSAHSSPSGSAAAGGTSSSASPASGGLTRISGDGSPTRVAGGDVGASPSPDGTEIAFLQPVSSGQLNLVAAGVDGAHPHILGHADPASTAITWSTDGSIHFISVDGHLSTVDSNGRQRSLASPTVANGYTVVFSRNGHWAFVAGDPLSDGSIVDLTTGHSHSLQGSRGHVAFAPDGDGLAWLDESGSQAKLSVGLAGGGSWNVLAEGAYTDLAVSPFDGRIAVVRGGNDLRILNAGTGVASAHYTADGTITAPVWSPLGKRVAFVHTGADGSSEGEISVVPGTTPNTGTGPVVPQAATDALQLVVDAQVRADSDALAGLVSNGVDPGSLTATGVTRAYVVHTEPSGQTVTAQVRLVADATAKRGARFADETLTLHQSKGKWTVSAVDLPALQAAPTGPQVTGVTASSSGGMTTILVSFDSDLDAASVSGAVVVRSAGDTLDATVGYDPASRAATVNVATPAKGALQVQVGTTLHDANGQPPSKDYRTTVQP